MSKTMRQYISQIHVNKPNLDYISKTGKINGSLLISIEKAMQDYSQSKTQELIDQNRELIEVLQNVANLLDSDSNISVESIKRVLTKYNHLKQKDNETN